VEVYRRIVKDDLQSRPRLPGSPYVPLESWVYPAIERLVGQGLIDTAFLDLALDADRMCAVSSGRR